MNNDNYNQTNNVTSLYSSGTDNQSLQFTDEQYMQFPELLDRQVAMNQITLEQKKQIEDRIAQRQNEHNSLEKQTQKQYVYTMEDKKAGFLDVAYFPTLIIIGFLIIIAIVIVGLI